MCGMSFREFLELKMGFNFMPINLETLLNNHTELAKDIATQAKPILKHFKDYLIFGYYPIIRKCHLIFLKSHLISK